MDSCYTTFDTYKFQYLWTLDKFDVFLQSAEYDKTGTIIQSSPFTVKQTEWHFELKLHGWQDDSKGFIGLYLHLDKSNESTIWANFTYSIIQSKKTIINNMTSPFWKFNDTQNGWGYGRFVETKILLDSPDIYLPNGQFKIFCDIYIRGDIKSSILHNCDTSKPDNSNFSKELSALLTDDKFNDVAFLLAGETIRANEGILSARSPVFKSMFEHELVAKNLERRRVKVIHLTDFNDPLIFRKVLQYMYTNEVSELNKSAMDLLIIAEKYQMDDLKKMCEEDFRKNINIDNAAEIFSLIHTHDVKTIKDFVENFMKHNIKDILKTPGFTILEKEHPQLAMSICRSALVYKCT